MDAGFLSTLTNSIDRCYNIIELKSVCYNLIKMCEGHKKKIDVLIVENSKLKEKIRELSVVEAPVKKYSREQKFDIEKYKEELEKEYEISNYKKHIAEMKAGVAHAYKYTVNAEDVYYKFTSGISMEKLADEYGVSARTIRRRIKEFESVLKEREETRKKEYGKLDDLLNGIAEESENEIKSINYELHSDTEDYGDVLEFNNRLNKWANERIAEANQFIKAWGKDIDSSPEKDMLKKIISLSNETKSLGVEDIGLKIEKNKEAHNIMEVIRRSRENARYYNSINSRKNKYLDSDYALSFDDGVYDFFSSTM